MLEERPAIPLPQRIVGYDLARALAVFGMVLVNFKVVMGAGQGDPAWLRSLVGLLEGRAAATFVVLAGVGISLLTRKARRSGDAMLLAADRNRLLRRALFLFVVGLAYTPIWPADILHFYGVYIAVAACLIGASSRLLIAGVGVLMLGFVLLLLLLDYEQGWDWSTLDYVDFWTLPGLVRHLFFNGFHPVVPWLGFLLVGMLLGRQEMLCAGTRRRVFFWGLGVAAVAEGLSWGLIRGASVGASVEGRELVAALFGTSPMPPVPLYMLAGAGTACAIIAVCAEFGERFGDAAWLQPLISTGQLALSLYVAHVVLGMGVLDALGRLNEQSLPFSLLASTLFFLGGILFAHFWRKRFKRGPVEAVMRWLT